MFNKLKNKIIEWHVWRKIQCIYRIFQDSSEGNWIIGKEDSVRLYGIIQRLCRINKQINVIELGTGIGAATAILAKSIIDNGQGLIDTVEQWPKCMNIAKNLISEKLRKIIQFHQSDCDVKERLFQKCSIYKQLPKNVYNFILIDGPSYFIKDDHLIDTAVVINGDLFELLESNQINIGAMIYVDGRRNVVKFIQRFYKDYFQLLEGSDNWALFIRTKKRFDGKIKDYKMEKLIQQGYFNEAAAA